MVTHREKENFQYSMWSDESGGITDNINKYRYVRVFIVLLLPSNIHLCRFFHHLQVTFEKKLKFGSFDAEQRYHQQSNSLKQRNRSRDIQMDFSEVFFLKPSIFIIIFLKGMDIEGYCPKMLAIVDSDRPRSWVDSFIGWGWYCLFSFFLLSFPYRFWFEV